ncbi:MAG: hypothetical protein HND58_16240 [Planctomycetota bacterium]|nr:MAG: hypothetical protein HND58_16240 [Planctomycetota bacterium]
MPGDTRRGAGATRCRAAAPGPTLAASLTTAPLIALAFTIVVALPAITARAQPTPASENQPADPLADLLAGRPDATALGARLPNPSEAMDAYAAVESWLREWKEPENFETPAAAVRVSAYQHGRPVGDASEVVRSGAVDAPFALALATGRAKVAIRRELLPRGGVLGAELMPELTADLTLSVELAGPFTPLSRTELLNPDTAVRPGLTGVAVRAGELWAVEFPSQLMASGTAPAVRLAAMAAMLLEDPAARRRTARRSPVRAGRGLLPLRRRARRQRGAGRRPGLPHPRQPDRRAQRRDLRLARPLRRGPDRPRRGDPHRERRPARADGHDPRRARRRRPGGRPAHAAVARRPRARASGRGAAAAGADP